MKVPQRCLSDWPCCHERDYVCHAPREEWCIARYLLAAGINRIKRERRKAKQKEQGATR